MISRSPAPRLRKPGVAPVSLAGIAIPADAGPLCAARPYPTRCVVPTPVWWVRVTPAITRSLRVCLRLFVAVCASRLGCGCFQNNARPLGGSRGGRLTGALAGQRYAKNRIIDGMEDGFIVKIVS